MRSLGVHVNGKRIGTLFEGDDLWPFDYAPVWATDEANFDLLPALSRGLL